MYLPLQGSRPPAPNAQTTHTEKFPNFLSTRNIMQNEQTRKNWVKSVILEAANFIKEIDNLKTNDLIQYKLNHYEEAIALVEKVEKDFVFIKPESIRYLYRRYDSDVKFDLNGNRLPITHYKYIEEWHKTDLPRYVEFIKIPKRNIIKILKEYPKSYIRYDEVLKKSP